MLTNVLLKMVDVSIIVLIKKEASNAHAMQDLHSKMMERIVMVNILLSVYEVV